MTFDISKEDAVRNVKQIISFLLFSIRYCRTVETSEARERQPNLTNRFWRDVNQKIPDFYNNKPVLFSMDISCDELGEDDPRKESRGTDTDVLLLKGEPPCAWPYNQGVLQEVDDTSQSKEAVNVTEERCESDNEKLIHPEVEKGL